MQSAICGEQQFSLIFGNGRLCQEWDERNANSEIARAATQSLPKTRAAALHRMVETVALGGRLIQCGYKKHHLWPSFPQSLND